MHACFTKLIIAGYVVFFWTHYCSNPWSWTRRTAFFLARQGYILPSQNQWMRYTRHRLHFLLYLSAIYDALRDVHIVAQRGRAIFCRHRISGCVRKGIGSTSCITFLVSTMPCVMYTLLPKDLLAFCLSNEKQKRDNTIRFLRKERQSTSHPRWETMQL